MSVEVQLVGAMPVVVTVYVVTIGVVPAFTVVILGLAIVVELNPAAGNQA